MANFQNLLAANELIQITAPQPKKKSDKGRGCEFCPLNEAEGVNKLKGLKKLEGKKVFVWGGSPSRTDNEHKKFLSGKPGEFFWGHLEEQTGITKDQCDVQNVIRCWPSSEGEYGGRHDRAPDKKEMSCCSIYTEQAIAITKGKARVHIILGFNAAKTLLGREFKKDTPVFWSDRLQGNVICLDHPSYFLSGAPRDRFKQFLSRLHLAKHYLKYKGRLGYVLSRKYSHTTKASVTEMRLERIHAFAKKHKSRVSVDIEDGWINDKGEATTEPSPDAKHVVLMIGFCVSPGKSFTVVLDHPENKQPAGVKLACKRLVRGFLQSKEIQFTLHHGSSDVRTIKEILGYSFTYRFDTNYSTYLKWPTLKKYGLENLAVIRTPEFAGYKSGMLSEHKVKRVDGFVNYAQIPLKVLAWYNGADCDVAKRLEVQTKDVNKPLLRTYTSVAFTLAAMQTRGPYYDKRHGKKVLSLLPQRLKALGKKLRKAAGNKDINLNSPAQIQKVLYDKFEFPIPEQIGHKKKKTTAKPTDKGTLEWIAKTTGHSFPTDLNEYRRLSKMDTTYVRRYAASAKRYGHLKTNWWLTGTETGRMSSGGKEEADIINFQNLHKDLLIHNLLVSDTRWRIIGKLLQRLDIGAARARLRRIRAFLAFDYSGIEVRMLAEASGDPLLIKYFNSGINIHCLVGHDLTGWSVEKIQHDEEIRRSIKTLHFALIYGASKPSVHADLVAKGVMWQGKIITRQKSDELYDKYYSTFKGFARWVENSRQFVLDKGYAETLFKFRRPIQTDKVGGAFWGNQALNTPLQGSAHQLMLTAMALLHEQPENFPELDTPVMEIHDALVFYSSLGDVPASYARGLQLLQTAVPKFIEKHFGYKFKVPLVAEAKAGFRMGTMMEYEGMKPIAFAKSWWVQKKKVDKKIDKEWAVAA